MKNKKLNLQKTTITKLTNLNSIRGGSVGVETILSGSGTISGIDTPTKTKTTYEFPDLTTTAQQ